MDYAEEITHTFVQSGQYAKATLLPIPVFSINEVSI